MKLTLLFTFRLGLFLLIDDILLGKEHNNVANGFNVPTSGITRNYDAPVKSLSIESRFNRNPLQFQSALYLSSSSESLAPGIDAINDMNAGINTLLNDLRTEPAFRLYSVDLLGNCEYMPQELFECYSESCEIYPVDDEEVSNTLKKLIKTFFSTNFNILYFHQYYTILFKYIIKEHQF